MRDEFNEENDPTVVSSDGINGGSPYITPEDVQAMQMERSVHPEESAEQTMRRIFKENASEAALAIVKVMKHDPNGNTRLRAAQLITDRVLGKIGDDSGEDDLLKDFLGDVVRYVEEAATN